MAKTRIASHEMKNCKPKFTRSRIGKRVVLNPLRHYRLTFALAHRTTRWGAVRKKQEAMSDRRLHANEQHSGGRRNSEKPRSKPRRDATKDDWTT